MLLDSIWPTLCIDCVIPYLINRLDEKKKGDECHLLFSNYYPIPSDEYCIVGLSTFGIKVA